METRRIFKEGNLKTLKNLKFPTAPASENRDPKKGLILIYLLDREVSGVEGSSNEEPVVALGLSFPGSKSDTRLNIKPIGLNGMKNMGQSVEEEISFAWRALFLRIHRRFEKYCSHIPEPSD